MSTYATSIPGAPNYGQIKLGAKTAYQNALARINQKRLQTMRSRGYMGDIDAATGTIKNMRVDPLNQYGGLQSMLRGQAQGYQQQAYSNQERGLRGGLANKGISELKYQAGAEAADFGQQFTGDLGNLQEEQTGAQQEMDRVTYQADLDEARDAIEAQRFNQANVPEADYPGYAQDPFEDMGPYSGGGAKMRDVVGKGATGQIRRGNTYESRNELLRRLTASRTAPSKWARQHPAAARQLGISPKKGANVKIMRQARPKKRRR